MKLMPVAFLAIVGLMPTISLAESGTPTQTNEQAVKADPKLSLAKKTKREIEETERNLAQQEQEAFLLIQQAIKNMPSDALTAQHDALDGLRQVTSILHQLSQNLLEKRNGIITDIDKLRRLNRMASKVFREASKSFEEYAREEPYEDIRKDYIRLAGIWTVLAKDLEKRTGQYDTENNELKEMLRYLERIALYLGRLHQHFEASPNTASIQEREKYIEDLKRFIKSFEKLRSLFGDFDKELRANALANDLPSAQSIMASAKKATAAATEVPTEKVPFYSTKTFCVLATLLGAFVIYVIVKAVQEM